MSKKRYPEQRSTTAEPHPGQRPGQPTGNEIFDTHAASQGSQAAAYSIERHDYELPKSEPEEGRARPAAAPPPRLIDFIRRYQTAALVVAFGIGIVVGWMRIRS